jgi:hypothetical protein
MLRLHSRLAWTQRSRTWLDRLYRLADPLHSLEEWERATHRDLARMEYASLRAERNRLHLRLLYDDAPAEWLGARLAAIQGALRRAR